MEILLSIKSNSNLWSNTNLLILRLIHELGYNSFEMFIYNEII